MSEFEIHIGLEAAVHLIESKKSFFLTGKAGTGKSTFLKNLVKKNKKNIAVLASTGIAALNIGGQTVHSFFQLPLRPILPNDQEIKKLPKNLEKKEMIKSLECLVIDEISMVNPDILDCIDKILRINKKKNIPFGGIQMILVGDLFQLPPIPRNKKKLPPSFNLLYTGDFFFHAYSFNNYFKIVELRKIFRQKDNYFIYLLEQVRKNQVNADTFELLNSRYIPKKNKNYNVMPSTGKNEISVVLTPRNSTVDRINSKSLETLNEELFEYKATETGNFSRLKNYVKSNLQLKKGAQVVFLRNHKENLWVNGTLGVVDELSNNNIMVKLENGDVVDVEKSTWIDYEYSFDAENGEVLRIEKGAYIQYPLRLAWALTIHKSQGMTFNKITIDIGHGTFSPGQFYVACSRASTLEGITFLKPIRPSNIKINSEVLEFYQKNNLS